MLRRDKADERGERAGLDARAGRILPVAEPREEVAGDPVRKGLRGRRVLALRGERGLEVVAELAAKGELLRAVGAQGQLGLKACGAVGGQLADRLARGGDHLLVDLYGQQVGL